MWDIMQEGLSGSTKRKIKKEIKQDKKKKEVSNLPARKPATGTTRKSIETPLDETEALLKKKVSIGELNEYMEVQEDRKKRREDAKLRGQTIKPGEQPQGKSILAELFKDSPEKLETMSPDNLLKLSMLQGGGGSGGGLNALMMMMMMNRQNPQQQTPRQSTSILDLVKAMKELKSLTNEDKRPDNQNNDLNQAMTLMMMERFMQNQQPAQGTNQLDLVKYLTTLIADQNKVKEDILTDKLRQLEYQVSKYDPLEEGAKMIEYMKNFKTLFGGSMTPEGLKHELDMKRLEMEEVRETRRNDDDDRKMTQIGSIIEKTVDTLSATLSEPIARGLEARMSKGPKKKRSYEAEGDLDDIDLDDLEDDMDYEQELAKHPEYEEQMADVSAIKRRNRSRFRVVDSANESE